MSKFKITLTGVAVLSLGVLMFISLGGGATKLSDKDIEDARTRARVFEVCNYTRVNKDVPETACGAIQDATNTEYLCKLRNTSPVNHCWVENK